MPVTLPQGFGNPLGDNYLTHVAEAKPPKVRKRVRPKFRFGINRTAKTKCQQEIDWLVKNAMFDRKKLKKVPCSTIHKWYLEEKALQ